MRCPKCQYVGFEPSPRCKNCGYELSLGDANDRPDDFDLDSHTANSSSSSLTLIAEPDLAAPMADFDLQIFDDVPAKRVQSGAKPFDLDDLLANGPSSGSGRETEPVIQQVSAVARRRQSAASSKSASASASASAVATPPPMQVEALFKPAPAKRAPAPVFIAEPVVEPVVEAVVPTVVEPVVEPVIETVFVPEPEPVVEAVAAMQFEPVPAPEPVRMKAPPAAPPAPVTTELPLFMKGMSELSSPPAKVAARVHAPVPSSVEAAADVMRHDAGPSAGASAPVEEIDDRPMVQVPASPRAPLAVRRTTPDPARLRAKYDRAARAKAAPVETSGDLLNSVADMEMRPDNIVPPAQRLSAEPTPTSLPAGWLPGVGPAKRLAAAAVDGALLVVLNAAVIWFTLSVCGLGPAQARLLPLAPLALFFLLLDAGYLVLFTAACGQTIGKMAAGIRVVGTTTGAVINDRITIGQAVMRSLGSIVSMLPLGAGFWFGLVGDRRAAHDRLAHTRVVAAS